MLTFFNFSYIELTLIYIEVCISLSGHGFSEVLTEKIFKSVRGLCLIYNVTYMISNIPDIPSVSYKKQEHQHKPTLLSNNLKI